jgi:hypothetical protein
MKATELFHEDGSSAWIYYCGECRTVARSEVLAEECCKPKICRKCQAHLDGWRLDCEACQRKATAERDHKRYAEAERVSLSDYDQPMVYLEQADKFIRVDELEEEIDEWDGDEPLRVYGVHQRRMSLDADGLIESGCDELHEEAAEEISADGRRELQAALDAWKAEHSPTSYEQDCGVVVVLG